MEHVTQSLYLVTILTLAFFESIIGKSSHLWNMFHKKNILDFEY
jgi:hypothetical protein